MPYPVRAAMFANCDDVVTVDAGGSVTATLPERCEISSPPEAVSEAVAAILQPDVKLDLVRRLADLDTKLTNYQRLIKRGEGLDEFLSKAEL